MTDAILRGRLSRRGLLAGAATLAPMVGQAQTAPPRDAELGAPASTITNPPRDWTPGKPSIYPDPDVVAIDPSFRKPGFPGNAPIRRVWTGAQWAEGPAWSSRPLYLLQLTTQGAAPG